MKKVMLMLSLVSVFNVNADKSIDTADTAVENKQPATKQSVSSPFSDVRTTTTELTNKVKSLIALVNKFKEFHDHFFSKEQLEVIGKMYKNGSDRDKLNEQLHQDKKGIEKDSIEGQEFAIREKCDRKEMDRLEKEIQKDIERLQRLDFSPAHRASKLKQAAEAFLKQSKN